MRVEEILRNRVKVVGDGEWSLIGTPDDIIKEIEAEKMKEYALQQLTGFHQAHSGDSIVALAESMGMDSDEWSEIKEEAQWLDARLVEELDEHFAEGTE